MGGRLFTTAAARAPSVDVEPIHPPSSLLNGCGKSHLSGRQSGTIKWGNAGEDQPSMLPRPKAPIVAEKFEMY